MVTNGRRRVLMRSLPVLLLLVLAFAAAPHRSAPPQRAAVSCPAATAPTESAEPVQESTSAAEPPADRVAVLSSQVTAGARGSRAPPAASV